MAKERFEKGDLVRVFYDVPPGEQPSFDAVFIRGPQGPGDTYKLTVEGEPVEINGNCRSFEGIWPRTPTTEDRGDER